MKYLGVIYKITCNTNGKVYIGQTIQPIHKRWYQHKRYSSFEKAKIYYAMRKHGIDSFTIKVMVRCYSAEELNNREKYYIKLFNSIVNGYNTQTGGRDNFKHSEESRLKMSKDRLGVKKPDGFGDKISKALTGNTIPKNIRIKISNSQKGNKSAWWGKKHTLETKQKIREGNLNKKVSSETRNKISEVKKGTKWSVKTRASMTNRGTKKTKRVLNTVTGIIYYSLKDAGIIEKINPKQIGDVCRGRRLSTHGKYFKYL